MSRRYSPEVKQFIVENVVGRSTQELAQLVSSTFGIEFTESQCKSYKTNHKLKSGLPRGAQGSRYSDVFPEPIARYILQHYKDVGYQEMADRLAREFGTAYTKQQIKSFYGNRKLNSGRTGHFQKGRVPFNKGKKGWCAPGTERTRFKKGNLPANTKPIGYERLNVDGYIEVKVAMRPSRPDCNDNFIAKHRLVWEAANGPIPAGHKVIFKGGDKTNCNIDNLVLVTDAEHLHMIRRGLRSASPQLTETGVLIARAETLLYKVTRKQIEERKEKTK